MKLNYINKIKANISISSNKKTSNILEGTYTSVYRGKSMNFENLREYVINDDVKDIDWKSSARSASLLVKQFIAEKKHNVMLVMDTGLKMSADTDLHESKKNVALFTAGTIGYIVIKNSDYVGMTYYLKDKIKYRPFRYNLYNLEEYLLEYDKYATDTDVDINELLKYVYKNIAKRMIVFIITDMAGIDNIKPSVLKALIQRHDALIVNINDNTMTGDNVYDINQNKYLPNFLLKDEKLNQLEKNLRADLIKRNTTKLAKYGVSMASISSIKEISTKIIELLEEHKYANRN